MKTEAFQIQRAERRHSRLRLAVCAASNGGKTFTSLELAFGIVQEYLDRGLLSGTLEGKVGVVDTERKSAQLYQHLGPYDTIDLGPPYSVERYRGALETFERAGYFVVILDSITHAWSGSGGLLAMLAAFEAHERFASFNTAINPQQDEFVDAMLRSPCHVIATMRSKTEWVLEDRENRQGRVVKTPRRVGMAPIQRPGIEYEFTTLLDLDTDSHVARVLKNRCPVFDDWTPRVLKRSDGASLAAWMLEAKPEASGPGGTPEQVARAMLETAIAAMSRCSNLPDLARVFGEAWKALNAHQAGLAPGSAPWYEEVLSTLVEVKDRRKAALGTPPASIPAGDPVSPDGCVLLETALSEYGIPLEQFKGWAGVPLIAALPASRWDEACLWISTEAAKRGHKTRALPAMPAPRAAAGPEPARTAVDVVRASIEKEAAKRGGLFADMKDDVPL